MGIRHGATCRTLGCRRYDFQSGFCVGFQPFVNGGRLEGSKRNMKFQSAMWHHFKHFQSKDFFSWCLSFTALELFCHNYMENP
jgi:hypothetical protein